MLCLWEPFMQRQESLKTPFKQSDGKVCKGIHLQKCYKDLKIPKGTFPIAEEISNTELSLPMYYGMTDEEISYVIKAINEF